MDLEGIVTKQLLECSNVLKLSTENLLPTDIVLCAGVIVNVLKEGGKVVLFGNGGSAADAQHIAAEFVGLLRRSNTRKSLEAIALTTNTSILTALVNDYGTGDVIFTRQLEACGKKGDVAIGISTGGNSSNIVLGLQKAKELEMITIGFTGAGGGKVAEVADFVIKAPSCDTPRIQEVHITIGHIICDLVEQILDEEVRDV